MDNDLISITPEEHQLFEKLKVLYRDVKFLTANHNVIGDYAVVFPNDLGQVLEKIDPDWYDNFE